MKSIGVAVILAQIGYNVPAEKFVYEPSYAHCMSGSLAFFERVIQFLIGDD